MTNIFTLTNGDSVTMATFIKRSAFRDFVLTSNAGARDGQRDPAQAIKGMDGLVFDLVEAIERDGQRVEKSRAWFDELNNDDYQTMEAYVLAILEGKKK